jgi:hypothetical protein
LFKMYFVSYMLGINCYYVKFIILELFKMYFVSYMLGIMDIN